MTRGEGVSKIGFFTVTYSLNGPQRVCSAVKYICVGTSIGSWKNIVPHAVDIGTREGLYIDLLIFTGLGQLPVMYISDHAVP